MTNCFTRSLFVKKYYIFFGLALVGFFLLSVSQASADTCSYRCQKTGQTPRPPERVVIECNNPSTCQDDCVRRCPTAGLIPDSGPRGDTNGIGPRGGAGDGWTCETASVQCVGALPTVGEGVCEFACVLSSTPPRNETARSETDQCSAASQCTREMCNRVCSSRPRVGTAAWSCAPDTPSSAPRCAGLTTDRSPVPEEATGGGTISGTSADLENPLGSNSTNLPGLIGRAIKVVLGVIGAVALLMFVFAGILWITSAGKDKQVEQAQGILKNATIGLLLIFFSYTIINAFLNLFSPGTGSKTKQTSTRSR